MRKEARLLKSKAVESLRRAAQAFNGLDDAGRATTVLLHLQHAFEMLLKAALVERRVQVFDRKAGRSHGFEKCLNLAKQHLGLQDPDAGTLRTIDALRDDEQHYLGALDEGLLYLHVRAAVSIFDELLQSVFKESLAGYLPDRVLPISTQPPVDIDLLIDRQFSQAKDLLQPGRRKRAEAHQAIRALLALEAHVADAVTINEKDVRRVEKAIIAGKSRAEIFPRLSDLGTTFGGSGLAVTVHFSRKGDGAPVRYVAADDPAEAAAIREVDLQRRYRYGRSELAKQLGLDAYGCATLREFLAIDDDAACAHVFEFGASAHPMYSDAALQKMRNALGEVDLNELVRERRARQREARQNGGESAH